MFVNLKESLLSFFEYNPDPCYVLDTIGNFIDLNEATLKLTGYSRKELLEMSYHDLIAPEQIYQTDLIFQQVISEGLKVDLDAVIYTKEREPLEISITAVPVIIKGQITSIIGMVKDMTKRKQLEQSLLKSQIHLKNIFDSIEVCLWSLNMTTGELQISPACEAIYGYSQEDFMRDPDIWRKVILANDRMEVEKRQKKLKLGKKLKHEYRIQRSDGCIRWLYDYTVPVLNTTGDIIRLDGVINDITERKKIEERLQTLAFHDALTGLPNRRLIRDRLRMAIIRAQRKKNKVATMFLDLDGFKFINDSFGHSLGDRILRSVATRLKRCLQQGDIARIGGDEFMIILEEGRDFECIEIIADNILNAISQPFKIKNQEFMITTSIGISFYPEHGHDYDILIKRADQAMYLAKAKGRNKFQIFNSDISNKFQRRLMLEQGLRKAIQHNEFIIHYQPIVNIATGSIIGTEALIRWNHPSGIISPLEFIPIAEESGLIVPIGEWVLRSACAQNKHWQNLGFTSLFISVNLSVWQLEQENLIEKIQNILLETGLDPHFLHIEITESSTMTNINRAIHMLKALSDIGISISIDDFGTGYSSLSYLEKFPINTIKIDQSFIRTNQMAIIKAIITMASGLNLNVIAEGVENETQMRQLHELGCLEMQGYWFSEPVCSQKLLESLMKEIGSFRIVLP